MTQQIKILAALPLIALLAACNASGGGGVNSTQDLERTLDEDLDADGSITTYSGVETAETD